MAWTVSPVFFQLGAYETKNCSFFNVSASCFMSQYATSHGARRFSGGNLLKYGTGECWCVQYCQSVSQPQECNVGLVNVKRGMLEIDFSMSNCVWSYGHRNLSSFFAILMTESPQRRKSILAECPGLDQSSIGSLSEYNTY